MAAAVVLSVITGYNATVSSQYIHVVFMQQVVDSKI